MQFKQMQQQDYQEEVVPFGTNSKVIGNLVISQTYEVQVLATNRIGPGPPSKPATIYVGEAGECIDHAREQDDFSRFFTKFIL